MSSARERILDAAVRRIAREGIDDARIARIATDAGVSSAAVHYHFASREALLAEALEHSYARAGDVRMLTGEDAPLFHPRRQRWDEHFAWEEGFDVVIGLTPAGRATVVALRLNREGLVNFRRVLYAQGKHPPATR